MDVIVIVIAGSVYFMSDYQLIIITDSTMKSFKLRSLPNSLFINKTPTRDIFPNFVHFHFHFSLKNLPHEKYFQTSFFTKKISHMIYYQKLITSTFTYDN